MQIVGRRGGSPTAVRWVHPVSLRLSWVLPFSQVHLVKEEKATSETNYKQCDCEIQTLSGKQSKEPEIPLCCLFALFVKSDHQLAVPVPQVTLDYRPHEKVVTAPIFSSSSPSAKRLLPVEHVRHLLVPV